MPGFEEEALERARQMTQHRRSAPRTEPKREEPRQPEKPSLPEKPEPPPKPPKPVSSNPQEPPNMMEILFRNKENSLIMMLLLLLMDEKNDPSLLFALMYLLM